MKEAITLTTFTDPMMGLTYEMEPIYEHLMQVYGGRLRLQWVMSLLVRSVRDFMTDAERALPPEEGIRRYNTRLARICKQEESIGGLPMRMEGFCLFDKEHTTSLPLNLAYKAAQLADPPRADEYLWNLRHATVLSGRPTTHFEVLLEVARETGIDAAAFAGRFNDGSALAALNEDLALTRRMGVTSLPACLLQRGDRARMLQSFRRQDYEAAIEEMLRDAGR